PPAPPPNPGPRNFNYNDGPGGNPPTSNPNPSRPNSPPRMPLINEEPEVDQAEWAAPAPPKKGFMGGRREKGRPEKQAARLQATPSNSPYVDLVGVDGYGPPLERMEERRGNRMSRLFA